MRGKKKVNDFGSDPIPLLVLKISVPFMFAQFVNVLYNINPVETGKKRYPVIRPRFSRDFAFHFAVGYPF